LSPAVFARARAAETAPKERVRNRWPRDRATFPRVRRGREVDRPLAAPQAKTRLSEWHTYGMVVGMASVKVTVTLGEQELEQIRSLVAEGQTGSVSGFVQHAVRVGLADVRGWGAMLAQALEETGGPLSDSERRFADSVLKAEPKRLKARRRRAA